jgi:hypothetical protein
VFQKALRSLCQRYNSVMRQQYSVSEPGPGPFLFVGTYLPMQRWRDMPAFLKLVGKVHAQMKRSEGVVRVGVNSSFLFREFWTCSVWRMGSDQAIQDFVHSGAHVEALRKSAQWSGGKTAFARWMSPSPAMDFNELLRRLPPRP